MQHGRQQFGRGVWIAPWVGKNGELVLLAITSDNRLVGEPLEVPVGSSHILAADAMWERIERANPIPILKII